MIAKLNILFMGHGVYFMDANNSARTTLVHCMSRVLFEHFTQEWGANNAELARAIREADNALMTVTVPAEKMYETLMSDAPMYEAARPGRDSLLAEARNPNAGRPAMQFNLQYSNEPNRIIAKSLYDAAHHIAWYSYESMAGAPRDRLEKLARGEVQSSIDSEIVSGLNSPSFFDLFGREPILLTAFAGFEANLRNRGFREDHLSLVWKDIDKDGTVQPQPASKYLSDRPLKDIKDILCHLGMNESDAITFATNLGQAGLSIGTDLHNEIIRDIRGLLVNKIKQN